MTVHHPERRLSYGPIPPERKPRRERMPRYKRLAAEGKHSHECGSAESRHVWICAKQLCELWRKKKCPEHLRDKQRARMQ